LRGTLRGAQKARAEKHPSFLVCEGDNSDQIYEAKSPTRAVFKLDSAGNDVVLHSFTGTPDGAFPRGQASLSSSSSWIMIALYAGSPLLVL
jgi:hypothetical protein